VTDRSFAEGLVGITLDGRYRLDAVLGEGGMGAVFRATHVELDRKVAVKLLKPHLASDDEALQRFAREARTTRKVESPHAVKILDFGITPQRDYYMVLEYLDGRTVQRELEVDGAFAPTRVAHIARQALGALGVAHDQGLIHRDVKPDNLLLMRSGTDPDYTKILDFGVAKLMQGAAGEPAMLSLTAAGMVFGTPEFMSPEQACGQELDGRSDLYSLAATMFVMLTGTALFDAARPIELLTHHVRTPPPRLATVRPALAAYPALDDLVQRCLAKQRDRRPETAEEMEALIAAVEPTLYRGFAGAVAVGPRAVRSASTSGTAPRASGYVAALRETDVAVAADPATDLALADTRAVTAVATPAVPGRRRSNQLLAGAIVAGLIGLGLGLVGTRRPAAPGRATAPTAGAVAANAVAGAPGPVEAIPANAVGSAASDPTDPAEPIANAVGSAASDPGPVVRPVASVTRVPARSPAPPAPRNPDAEEHLRGAEDALRANNSLRQLAEADLALRADPNSVRAKYLLGDALIKSGDLDRGCTYLGALRRNAAARARARSAGCPDN
jgi:serine/threonine-protein kinase